MARTQGRYYPDNEVYRVKIQKRDEDGTVEWEITYGPYASEATAKGVGTQKTKRRHPQATHVQVQRAHIEWQDVED